MARGGLEVLVNYDPPSELCSMGMLRQVWTPTKTEHRTR